MSMDPWWVARCGLSTGQQGGNFQGAHVDGRSGNTLYHPGHRDSRRLKSFLNEMKESGLSRPSPKQYTPSGQRVVRGGKNFPGFTCGSK